MELKQLNRTSKQNRYCGPAVISFLTGANTDECATVIRSISGQRSVKGSSRHDVVKALAQFGVSSEILDMPKLTLVGALRVLRDAGRLTAGRVYLVIAGNHYQLVTGRRYACGRIGEIVSIADPRVKRRARVTGLYEVKGESIQSPAALAQAKVQKRATAARSASQAKDRAYCKAAEARGVVSIEIDNDLGRRYIIVWPGRQFIVDEEGETVNDPCSGDHYCDDWQEAAVKVRAYEAAI